MAFQSKSFSPTTMDLQMQMEDDSAPNRGNYRCSRCGEPKKGHVCPYQPMNFTCRTCGNPKRNCVCGTPSTATVAIQCEMDADMTTSCIDLEKQGYAV